MSPAGGATAPSTPSDRNLYFFLSYAHSAPLMLGHRVEDPDKWVKVFFDDLSREIRQCLGISHEPRVGFFDGTLPEGADWKAELAEALGSAHVFVPLCSPGYFSNSWPLGELAAFRRRLRAYRPGGAEQHVAPVLWIPMPSWEQTEESREALRRISDVPAYGENGLRALCMLSPYRQQYRAVLGRLAEEIAEVAQHHPLPATVVPTLDQTPRVAPSDPQFVVMVVAPTRDELAAGHDSGGYDVRAEQWRPFGDRQALPAANYVAGTAERLGLATLVTDFTGVDEVSVSRPVILLIDPWILDLPDGEQRLATLLARLPTWTVPLVVVDGDDQRNARRRGAFADRVAAMLAAADRPVIRPVRQLGEFEQVMSSLVTDARRRYLRNAPQFSPPRPPVPRHRLGSSMDSEDGQQLWKRDDG